NPLDLALLGAHNVRAVDVDARGLIEEASPAKQLPEHEKRLVEALSQAGEREMPSQVGLRPREHPRRAASERGIDSAEPANLAIVDVAVDPASDVVGETEVLGEDAEAIVAPND